jgi:hypothetical protein
MTNGQQCFADLPVTSKSDNATNNWVHAKGAVAFSEEKGHEFRGE